MALIVKNLVTKCVNSSVGQPLVPKARKFELSSRSAEYIFRLTSVVRDYHEIFLFILKSNILFSSDIIFPMKLLKYSL